MALEKQTASVNLTGSLDTKTEPFTVEASGVLISENTDYEFPNKLMKQKGLEDYSLPVIVNTDFTTNSGLTNFDAGYYQYNLLKNNDSLAIIPKPSYPYFMRYDKGDEIFKIYRGVQRQGYSSPLQIGETLTSTFETSTVYGKAWGSWFDTSTNKKIEFHVVSTSQGYEATINMDGTKKTKTEFTTGYPVQVKCAVWDNPLNNEYNSRYIVVYTERAGAVNTLKVDFLDNNLIPVVATQTVAGISADVAQFDLLVDPSDKLHITYYTTGGQFSTANFSITTGALTLTSNNVFTPTLTPSTYTPFIQYSGLFGDKLGFFYVDLNRDISYIVFDIGTLAYTLERSTAIAKDTILAEGGGILNQVTGLGCGGYSSADKHLICITTMVEDTGTPYQNGLFVRSKLYQYNSSTNTVTSLSSWWNLGSPTRIVIQSESGTVYGFYFGLSSGSQYHPDIDENDIVVFETFDDNALSPLLPKIVARYNNFMGYGDFSPSVAYEFTKASLNYSGRENGRNMRLRSIPSNEILIGSRIVSLRDISPEVAKNYDYKFFSFNNVDDILNTKFQKYNLLVGALPTSFDGVNFYPLNTSIIPYIYQLTSIAGGGSIPAGTYSCCYYIEYLNFDGSVERSPVSNIEQVVIGGPTDRIGFRLRLDNFKDEIVKRITYKFYMTEAGGTVFYLASIETDPPIPTSISTIITDVPSTTSEILYTQGGVLESQLLPPITYAHTAKSRIFVINGEDKNEILFSNKIIQGELPSFNGLLNVRQDSENSARNDFFTSISSMDDKIITFKRSNIFYFYGDGPNDLGTGSPFTELFKVSSDVGCSEPKSVVQTPLGVMFKSLKGYYLLGRDLTLIRIGEPVNAYQDLPCTMATLLEKKNEVRFLTETVTLCYNFEQNKWSVIKYGGHDASIFDDQYYILDRTTPALFKLSETGFLDKNGDIISMKIVSPWYKVSGIQDFGRFYHAYVLGRFKSAHTLNVRVYYDYDDTNYSDFAITPLSTDKQYQYRVNIPKQKCESIKFEIWDSGQVGTGESMELIDMTFTIGQKKGTFKLADRRRY